MAKFLTCKEMGANAVVDVRYEGQVTDKVAEQFCYGTAVKVLDETEIAQLKEAIVVEDMAAFKFTTLSSLPNLKLVQDFGPVHGTSIRAKKVSLFNITGRDEVDHMINLKKIMIAESEMRMIDSARVSFDGKVSDL
eukprot:TRINITY_DN3570_c0_g1_i1.p1 TRINITY_DN3570_c0_g1~~TRINITY_DN3570_c0_g1_i1.p1  ORF type:complete len:136 (+),score=40.08 TRINITY_DN3570_c0_g1_i1:124-531(+)